MWFAVCIVAKLGRSQGCRLNASRSRRTLRLNRNFQSL
jgi:hypothetical protein